MDIQRRIALHCGAVLLRKKPAALFHMPRHQVGGGELQRILNHHGLCCQTLCDRCESALVLVYDEAMLAGRLSRPAIRRTLTDIGYPPGALRDALRHLRHRARAQEGFPHEIGFFLGYPTEDVLGFMEHKGKHCKLCGLWKVYGDVARASAMFSEYCECKRRVLAHLENGGSLFTLPAELAG